MPAFVTAAPPAPLRPGLHPRPSLSPRRPRRVVVPAATAAPPPSDRPHDRSSEFELSGSPSSRADTVDGTSSAGAAGGARRSTPVTTADWAGWALAARPRSTVTIPALPFRPADVFLPGETKTLHLFEARYLALFEASLSHHSARCAHVLIDPARGAMAAHAVLLRLRDWRRLGVGVAVTADAVARIRATSFRRSAAPFLQADFHAVADDDLVLDTALAPPSGADAADPQAVGERRAHTLARLRAAERRFWPAFEHVAARAARLDVPALREKTDAAGVTIAAAEGRAVDTSAAALQALVSGRRGGGTGREEGGGNGGGVAVDAWAALHAAARRAAAGQELDFADDAEDAQVLLRGSALSFAGWEFFPSTPGQRQKALESKCAVSRMELVVDGLEQRAAQLAAQIAVKDALL